MSRRRIARLAASSSAVVAALAGAAVLTPATASAAESPESAYLTAMNQERHAHGLNPLVARHSLNTVASSWASHMAATETLSHNPRLAQSISNWQAVGENVGEGPDVVSLDKAFWNSPMHRENILDPSYKDVGIGAVERDGVIWITIDFRDPMHPVTTQPAIEQPQVADHHRTLRVGMTGRDVAHVQSRLNVSADGVFGPVTRSAVQRFQRHHDYRPTGVVGRRTWRAINK